MTMIAIIVLMMASSCIRREREMSHKQKWDKALLRTTFLRPIFLCVSLYIDSNLFYYMILYKSHDVFDKMSHLYRK